MGGQACQPSAICQLLQRMARDWDVIQFKEDYKASKFSLGGSPQSERGLFAGHKY